MKSVFTDMVTDRGTPFAVVKSTINLEIVAKNTTGL